LSELGLLNLSLLLAGQWLSEEAYQKFGLDQKLAVHQDGHFVWNLSIPDQGIEDKSFVLSESGASIEQPVAETSAAAEVAVSHEWFLDFQSSAPDVDGPTFVQSIVVDAPILQGHSLDLRHHRAR